MPGGVFEGGLGVDASSYVIGVNSNCTKGSLENRLFVLALMHLNDGQDIQQGH